MCSKQKNSIKLLSVLSTSLICLITGGIASCSNELPSNSIKTQQEKPTSIVQSTPQTLKIDFMENENITVEGCKNINDYNLKDCINFANHCDKIEQIYRRNPEVYESDPSVEKCKDKGWEFNN